MEMSFTLILQNTTIGYLLGVGGVQACGCQSSLGPPRLLCLHGSFLSASSFAGAAPAVRCCSDPEATASLRVSPSGTALPSPTPAVRLPSAGTGCPAPTWPGAPAPPLPSSSRLAFAAQRASASAASTLICCWRTTSACCSRMEGGASRVCRSHWCHWGGTFTSP